MSPWFRVILHLSASTSRQVSASLLTNAKDDMRRESVHSHSVLQKLAERGTLSSASSSLLEVFASLEISAATNTSMLNLTTIAHTLCQDNCQLIVLAINCNHSVSKNNCN